MHNKRAFTIIELLIVLAIVAILVFLAVPKLMDYTRQARIIQLTHDAKVLENACEVYYLKYGDWPRASDTPYTAEQVAAFAAKVYDQTGKVIVLEEDGKYYDVDMKKLGNFVTINEAPENFVLQNPVGNVYTLDPQTNVRLPENNEKKPVAVIAMTPDQELLTTTVITWSYANSYDPNGGSIVNAEWQGKQDVYPTEGQYTVKLRVQSDKGIWSDWVEKTFTVQVVKPVAVITMTPNQGLTTRTNITWDYTNSFSSDGAPIVEAEWQGKQDVYSTPGTYTVTLRVKNNKGVWSDPVSVTFDVVAAKPVAAITITPSVPTTIDTVSFTTEGSLFTGSILGTEWKLDNNPVQTNPPNMKLSQGSHTISLRIQDAVGWSDWVSKTFTVSSFQLVTSTQNYLLVDVVEGSYHYNYAYTKIMLNTGGRTLNVTLTSGNFTYYNGCGGGGAAQSGGGLYDSTGKCIWSGTSGNLTLPSNAAYILLYSKISVPLGPNYPWGSLTIR